MIENALKNQPVLYLDCNIKRQWQICQGLRAYGLRLYLVCNKQEAFKMLKNYQFHLVLVHLDIGNKETFELCSLYRSTHTHAILMVLMDVLNVSTEELLFDYGASDVLVGDQVRDSILIRRIRVHFKRIGLQKSVRGCIRIGKIVIDFNRREVWRDGTIYRLPGNLAGLLQYFIDNPDRIISREELMRSYIWADSICTSYEEGGKTFDVHMSKLRKIIESDPKKPEIISTIRSLGWKLAVQPNKYEYQKERQYS